MHTNQRLMVEELIRRGASVSVVDEALELLEVGFGRRTQLVLDRSGPALSHVAAALAADKHLTKLVLRKNGIPVPEGELFAGGKIDEALAYGDSIGYPLVVKPNVGSNGRGVRSGIASRDHLEAALCALIFEEGRSCSFVVERHVEGREHRVFATSRGDFAVLLREAASVFGDGSSTIRELARAESERRAALKSVHGGSLSPIALDSVARDFLAARALDFESVPAAGAQLALRLSSNLSQGGSSTDMTDEAHPSAIAISKRALAAFEGLPCLGVDLVVPDIAREVGEGNPCAVIEVNSNPGLAMHRFPAQGRARDVARFLVDAMFPTLFSEP